MRRLIITVLVLAVSYGVRLPSVAADIHYYDAVYARPIYRYTFLDWGYGWRQFDTTDLKGGIGYEDTFMVITRPDGTEFYNDNCSSSTKRSCYWVYSDSLGVWTVTIFAAVSYGFGTMDVRRRTWSSGGGYSPWATLANDAPFGGTIVNLDLTDTEYYGIQTVHRPYGSDDTVLAWYDSSWQEKGYDDDGGINFGARIVGMKGYGDRVVVGSSSALTEGYTTLLANECTNQHADPPPYTACWSLGPGYDSDQDGLSDALEMEIGTAYAGPGAWDTDRDGLMDYFEVIGRDGFYQQDLKRYGALPLRRDLFVEIDHTTSRGGPLSEAGAQQVADVYSDLPELSPAPDGSRLINVHIDTGAPCNVPTLCGDWGGGNDDVGDEPKQAMQYGNMMMNATRRGLFHYGVYMGGGGGGGFNPGVSFRADGPANIAHELGHNFDLEHQAPYTLNTGPQRMPLGQAYPSIMNYNYTHKSPPDGGRFSRGQLDRLYSENFDETSYSPGVDKSYLTKTPFSYEVTGDAIDFNYDGRPGFPGGGTVAFDPAPMRWYTKPGWPDNLFARTMGTVVPLGGGALAVVPEPGSPEGLDATVWAFAPFSSGGGNATPYYATLTDTATDDPPASWPATWTSFALLADGHPNADVAAVTFDFSFGRRIVVVYPNANGALFYNLVDPAAPSASSWQPIPGWDPSVEASQASLAVVDNRVDIVWRDATLPPTQPNVYMANLDQNGSPSVPELQFSVDSRFTPGIAEGPDGFAYLATAEAGAIGTKDHLQLWRRDASSTDRFGWTELSGMGDIETDTEDAENLRRMNLLFVPLLGPNGPFADGSGYLAVFWNAGRTDKDEDTWRHHRAYTTGYLAPTGSTLGPFFGKRTNKHLARPYPLHSTAIAARWRDAVAMYTSSVWQMGQVAPPMYVPFANGTPVAPIGINTDENDASVIESSLCSSLWAADFSHPGCYCATLDEGDPSCGPPLPAYETTCDGINDP